MKKVLVFALALMFALSLVLLVACDVTVIDLKIEGAPSEVEVGDAIDYSTINVVATLEDGTTKTLPLTDKSVRFTPIDTSSKGDKPLTARYGGKSATVIIAVKQGAVDVTDVTVTEVNNTVGYNAYLAARGTQTDKETEFVTTNGVYKVGATNGYKCVPVVTIVDVETGDEDIPLPEAQIVTTFELYTVEGANSFTKVENPLATYLEKVENNVYYFNSNAVNLTFKLEVKFVLSEGMKPIDPEMKTSFDQIFTVVDGYNVYDAWGLSVLDNLNIQSWSESGLKEHKCDWDDGKALSEFTDVSQVILHNNITISADYLPSNYFWQKGEPAKGNGISYDTANGNIANDHKLKGYLAGSLKETNLGEAWENGSNSIQRGLYVSDGIGISGNYLTIGYDPNCNTDGENALYIVYDYSKKGKTDYPEAHWSVIRYEQADSTSNRSATIENVYFVGETSKTENLSLPAGLMMMSSDLTTTTLTNTIGTDWFANVVSDAVDYGTLNIIDSKLYNSFSSMVFSRRMVEINVTNSEMKAAGGPLFIIHTRTGSADDSVTNTVLNVSSTAKLESWLSGGEMWFEINDLEAPIIRQLATIASISDTVNGIDTHYRRATSGADFQINIIAVVIPDPSKVFSNQDAIKGTINVGGEYQYGMEESLYSAVINLSATAGNAIKAVDDMLNDETLQGQFNDYAEALGALKAGFGQIQSATAQLPYAPLVKCGNDFAYVGGSMANPQFTRLTQIVAGLTTEQKENDETSSLYGGVKFVITALEQKIAQAEQYGMTDVAAALTKHKTAFEQVKAGLDPIATYKVADETWSAGQLACWINPAAMGSGATGNKHFMILIGEDKAA